MIDKKNMTIQKCKKCGSEDFWVIEHLLWKAYIADGVLQCTAKDSTVEQITCKKCDEPLEREVIDSMEIQFN